MMSNRNLNIEFLRILMMFAIVALHISGQMFDVDNLHLVNHQVEPALFLSIRSLFFLGVSTFAFISGYYGVKFSIKKIIALEMKAVSIGLMLVAMCFCFGKHIDYHGVISFIFPLTSNVCWYFSAYILLVTISPFLNSGIERLNQKAFTCCLAIVLFLYYVGDFIYHRNGTTFMLLFVVYLVAQYLKKYEIAILTKQSARIFIVALSLNVAAIYISSYWGFNKLFELFENNHNPLLLIGAASLFYTIKKIKRDSMISKVAFLAKYMFPLYILHVELLSLNILPISNFLDNIYLNFLLYTIAIFLLGSFFCAIIEKLFSYIENNFLALFDKL